MTNKINNIIEELKSLTLLESSELVKQIEITFNVDTSSIDSTGVVLASSHNTSSLANEIEEKTEFDIILEDVPATNKIAILKVVRSLTSLGLKEAKDLVESAPKAIKESLSKEDAEEMKNKLEDAGAKVSIK